MKRYLFAALLGFSACSYAQENDTLSIKNKLPFYIDDSKKIPDFELDDKKTGTFITGVPRFEFDPIRGFGVGGNVNLFMNKDNEDPFFEYTPYRHKLNAEFFIYENGRMKYAINYDAPYIFDSKWRLRADAVVWQDPEAQYWGMGRNTLQPLQFRDKTNNQVRNFKTMNSYERNLNIAELATDGNYYADTFYNNMEQDEMLFNLLAERVLMGGRLRVMFGYEALFTKFHFMSGERIEDAKTLSGQKVDAINNTTKVEEDIASGLWDQYNLAGFNNSNNYNFTSMLAWALMYDTRDFEPDPSKGLLLQYSHEYSAPFLGSQFNFNKLMLQGQYFNTLYHWNNNKNRITVAGLAAVGHIFGPKINFIEMWDLSSQAEAGGIMVMGGERSIRGYREARFMAPTTALLNIELRGRFYNFDLLKQHFTLGSVLFYDAGNVWDSPSQMTMNGWRGAPGLGARIGWNQSTIIRLDYAVSREGSQVFFGMNHIF